MRVNFCIFWIVLICALNSIAIDTEKPVIILKTIGNVPQELTVRVVDWLTQNIGSVTNAGVLDLKPQSFKEIVNSIHRPEKDQVILVLANELLGESQHVLAKRGLVILNLGVMRSGNISLETNKEAYARRVEKSAVGGSAFALGLNPCRLIFCSLYPTKTMDELDQMARTLCPPCMVKLTELRLQGTPMKSKVKTDSSQPAKR